MLWYFKILKPLELLIELNKLQMENTHILDQKKKPRDGLKYEVQKRLKESSKILSKTRLK